MTTLFKGLFDNQTITVISVDTFLLCLVTALILGLLIALCANHKSDYTESFFIALILLPAVVCILIMMVNGNIGAGVAIAGAFALVRFRSSQGDARQITVVFLAMAAGLIVGMGYIAYAVLFTVVMCVILVLFSSLLESGRRKQLRRTIKITIPEDLEYPGMFDQVFQKYTRIFELKNVRTTNLGSLFKLTYRIILVDPSMEKKMIDDLRCLNGNLDIMVMDGEDPLSTL